MKKITIILLQIFLSILLAGFGYIVEQSGVNQVNGAGTFLFFIPGITILVSPVFSLLKKEWRMICGYLLTVVILDVAAYFYFEYSQLKPTAYAVYALVGFITALICLLFHFMYGTTKKKK